MHWPGRRLPRMRSVCCRVRPIAVRCKPADGVIEVTYGKLTETRVFTLRAEALGAILIAYCNRAGMPMPRGADKAVRIEREHVVVVFTLRISRAQQPEAPEGSINRLPDAVSAWSWVERERLTPLPAHDRRRTVEHAVRGQRHDKSDRTAHRGADRRSPTATRSAMSAPMSGCPAARISPSIRRAPAQAGCGRSRQGAARRQRLWCTSPPTS